MWAFVFVTCPAHSQKKMTDVEQVTALADSFHLPLVFGEIKVCITSFALWICKFIHPYNVEWLGFSFSQHFRAGLCLPTKDTVADATQPRDSLRSASFLIFSCLHYILQIWHYSDAQRWSLKFHLMWLQFMKFSKKVAFGEFEKGSITSDAAVITKLPTVCV